MTKRLSYIAPIALVGLMASATPATTAVWSGSMARGIDAVTAERGDAPLVLVRRGGGGRGGGGGGFRGGGGGGAAAAILPGSRRRQFCRGSRRR